MPCFPLYPIGWQPLSPNALAKLRNSSSLMTRTSRMLSSGWREISSPAAAMPMWESSCTQLWRYRSAQALPHTASGRYLYLWLSWIRRALAWELVLSGLSLVSGWLGQYTYPVWASASVSIKWEYELLEHGSQSVVPEQQHQQHLRTCLKYKFQPWPQSYSEKPWGCGPAICVFEKPSWLWYLLQCWAFFSSRFDYFYYLKYGF